MVKNFTRMDDYAEHIRQLFPSLDGFNNQTVRNVTFQVTGACNLNCSYCYEHCKECEAMTLDTGKKIVDYLLNQYEKDDGDLPIEPKLLFWILLAESHCLRPN